MSACIKRVFQFTSLFIILLVLFASHSHAGPVPNLSPEEQARLLIDPYYAQIQQMKEQLKPVPEVAKLQQVVGKIPAMSDDQLDKLLAIAEKAKQRVMDNKKILDGLLEAQKVVITAVERAGRSRPCACGRRRENMTNASQRFRNGKTKLSGKNTPWPFAARKKRPEQSSLEE